MKRLCFRRRFFLLYFFVICICCSCGKKDSGSSQKITKYQPGVTHVLVPECGNKETVNAGPLTLDFSNASKGYFMGSLEIPDTTVNIQVTGPDKVIYKYFLNIENDNTALPFTAGDGTYLILAFENIGDDRYTPLLSYSLDVTLENEFLPFLYPNQYVNFTKDSDAVGLAEELSADMETDLDALTAIYQYVTENIRYDDEKAASVETGYLPDVDETLQSKRGICFDYAALSVCMLRSLSIPAQLNIGYSGDIRHAWIDVYIESVGWVENAIEFNGNEWKMMDPTFASALGSEKNAREYIGDGSSYTLQYVR